MKKIIIGLVLLNASLCCFEQQWIVRTYHNELDNPVKVITHYLQNVQRIVQPKKKRKVHTQMIERTTMLVLNPGESKTITIKGDPMSAHRVLPGCIQVYDIEALDQTLLARHNVYRHDSFIISRNKRNKLKIHAEQA